MRLAFLTGLVLVFFVFVFHVAASRFSDSLKVNSSIVGLEDAKELTNEIVNKKTTSLDQFKTNRKINHAVQSSIKPAFYDLLGQPDELEKISELPENGDD